MLRLQINDYSAENYTFTILDLQGKVISHGEISNMETIIDLSSVESALYLLKISENNQLISTVKIIKL